jgi:hypothetical protein
MKIVDELYHLEGIKGNFYMIETDTHYSFQMYKMLYINNSNMQYNAAVV